MPLRATLQPLVEITSVCAQDPLQALDVGEWTDCCAVLIVTTGTGSTSTKIQLQSATEPVEEAFGDVSGGLSLPLHQAGTVYVAVTGFTRYLRWRVIGPVSPQTPLRVSIDVLLKRPDAGPKGEA